MNLLKLMTVGCLLSCFSGLMTSCSDDDDAGSKVLLRPVTAMEKRRRSDRIYRRGV